MKICVTSEGRGLDSQVDPRFGRAENFIIVDSETLKFEVVANPNVDGMGGVGVQSGQLMSEKGVKVVLTGNVGPNAFETLKAAGIEVISGVSGDVKSVIKKFKNGQYKTNQGPSVDSHFGAS